MTNIAAAAKADTPVSPSELGVAEAAAALAELMEGRDLIVATPDEPRANALARALQGMVPEAAVLFCPGTDALPGEDAPASPANVGQRVSALRRLRLLLGEKTRGPVVLVTTGEALAYGYPAADRFEADPPSVALGTEVELQALHDQLVAIGYVADERVDEPGEVALRGQVLDVFPADAEEPLRIEVVDGRIAAIRSYDPADQRSTGELDARELGRVTEPRAEGAHVSLIDHLPEARVIVGRAADARRRRTLALASDTARRQPKRARQDVIDEAAWQKALEGRSLPEPTSAGAPPARFVESKAPLRAFAKAARAALDAGERVVLLGGSRDLRFLSPRIGKALKQEVPAVSSWAEALAGDGLCTLEVAAEHGFRRPGVLAVAAADLLGSRAERDTGPSHAADPMLAEVGEFRVGDVVIHEDHGIGIVAGLEPLPATQGGDAIKLTYAHEDVRLVPVANADRLWRYGAEADVVRLDTLDGSSWQKRRGEIDAAIAESARQLTALAAERAKLTAPVLEPEPDAYERFAAGFPYMETPDQLKAIEAVRADLASGKPMDRLVVGDVGYGKTEVALRAAAVAALAGSQVAVAAPTTVLARQHLESFIARFEGTGVEVAGLSRLSSAAEKKRVKAGLADGSIGVVVGTGAVAGKGVAFKNLALVVIDEEQRFGAADKAKLQALSAGHVLSMSATPIPRTLQSALVGLRDLSVIATPPARRQPIRTSTGSFSAETLRAALLREKARGGQSFVVVPRIEDMASLAETLAQAVPELEVLQAHGKMQGLDIDDAMVRFGAGDADVLLATNIIEAGLDVPRANTMAIVRADRFGLSQLHQLRGRVGRGSRRGQVLLFTEAGQQIAPRTLKRLRTLEAFDRLGAGFAISARDLDMRGAGDLLGDDQAGHMRLIGVDLYQQLLEGALRRARGEEVERWTPELNLEVAGALSAEWIPDVDLRVSLYVRLARLTDEAALDRFEAELEDRFGTPPEAAHLLIAIARVRLAAHAAGVARIDAGPAAIAFTPRRGVALDGDAAGLTPTGDRLILAERIEDPAARLVRMQEALSALGEGVG